MATVLPPDTIAAFQNQGWLPGGPAAPPPAAAPQSDLASLPPNQQAALAGAPVPPPQPAYQPIGAPQPTTQTSAPAQGNISQADADAALQRSLTNGGPVKGQDGAGAANTLPLPAAGPVIPGGMRPSTQSLETKYGTPETAALKGSEQALRDTTAAVDRRQSDVAALQPLEAKARAQEEMINEQHMLAAEQQRQQDYANELAGEKWKRDKAHEAYDAAVAKGVDPGKYWRDKSVGGKIATALSLMAGGFTAGLHGGPNQAMEQVNKNIEREISGQREAIQGKKDLADEQDTHLSLFLKEGMDKQQASAAAAVLMRQQFAKQLDAKYQDTSNAVGKLTLAQAAQKNAQEMAKSEQEYAKLTGNQVTKKVDEKYQAASGGGGGNDRAKYQAYADGALKYNAEHPDKPLAILPYGNWKSSREGGGLTSAGTGGGGKVSARIATRLSAVDNAGGTIDAIEKIEKGSWGPTGTPQAQGAGAVAQARTAMLEAGIDSGAVNTVLPEGYNPADAHISGKYNERLRQARNMIEHQKKVIKGAVDLSHGGSDTDEGGGSSSEEPP